MNKLILTGLACLLATILYSQDYIITNTSSVPECGDASGTLKAAGGGSVNVIRWEVGTFNGVFTVEQTIVTSSQTYDYTVLASGTKSFRAYCQGQQGTSYTNVITITTYSVVNAGTITTSNPTSYNLVSGTGTLFVNGYIGTPVWEKVVGGSWVTLQSGSSYTYSGLTETTFFRVSVESDGTCDKVSQAITIHVYKPGILSPPTDLTDGYYIEGGVTNLSLAGNYGSIVRWEYSVDNGITWLPVPCTGNTYGHLFTATTKFRVQVDQAQFGQSYSNIVEVPVKPYTEVKQSQNLVSGANYVREQQVLMAGITDPSTVDALNAYQKRQVTTFKDGLGRPVQQNMQKASPLQKDLVDMMVYDKRGMQPSEYLPYVPGSTDGAYRTSPATEQLSFYANGTADKITDSAFPFAKSVIEKSPLGLVTEQGAAGQEWQPGNGHSKQISYSTNDESEVRLLNPDGTSTGFYNLNELLKVEITDQDGRKTQTLKDKAGRTILTRVQLDETINSTLVPWLETYYIYNQQGKIKYLISPKGTAALKANSWSFTQATKDQYVHEFVYDNLGRLIEKKVPGQAWMYYCYDRLDRLVLMQDGNGRNSNKWFFVKYDRAGRPVMKGLYQNTSHTSRTAVQQNVIDPLYALNTDKYYEVYGTALHGYTNQAFPTSSIEVLTVDYYGTYDLDYNGTADYAYTSQGLAGENTQAASAFGKPTGSKRLVLGTTTWLYDYIFYDAYGRVIQLRSNNHLSSAIDNLITGVYDFEGKLLIEKTYHNAGSGKTTTVKKRFMYDHTGRLKQIFNQNNTDAEVLAVHYNYNELGQRVEKNLHCASCTAPEVSSSLFLQSIDYRHTINGWLRSINNAQLTSNTVDNDETNDYFGMEFLYDSTEPGLNDQTGDKAYYNGNISAVKWKGLGANAGTTGQRSYKFLYDNAGRMKSALSQVFGTAWNMEVGANNEALTYDQNGNINTLTRNQRKHQLTGVVASYVSESVDDLTYAYNASMGDQLLKVTDAAANGAGFNNGTSAAANDYTYDASGSLISDLNKGISTITYNILGKPTLITFGDTRKIEYVYDAQGMKLTMKVYPASSSTPQTTTDYVNGFVYENNSLSFFASPEGRVVKNGSTLEYQYAIADQQGNTRVVFTSAALAPIGPQATFEGDANDGTSQFQNINTSNIVSFTAANHTTGGSKVIRMNQTYKIGPAKSVKVYPGDKIDVEVWEYHEGSSGFGSTGTPLTTLINAVAGAFGGVSGAAGESGMIYGGVNEAFNTFMFPGNQGSSRPAAYLNYILYDKDYKVLDMGWQLAPGTTFTKQKISFPTFNIKEAGYIFVYLSYDNDSNNWVYFDDFKVTHTPTAVIQYNEYYPFGLQASTSWTRDNSKNNFLYNAASELNQTSGWYEMFFRNYDPAIARFTGIDPMASLYASLSAYHYSANSPVMFNDPSGALILPGGPPEGYMDPYYQALYGSPRDPTQMTNEQWMASSRPGGPSLVDQFALGGAAEMEAIRNENNGTGGHWEPYGTRTYVNGELMKDDVEGYNWVPDVQQGSWIENRFFVEFKGDISFGPQGTASIMPGEGVVPAPYSNANEVASVNIKIMALTLLGFNVNNRDGFTKIKKTDRNLNQGIGFAYMGMAGEINREFLNGKIIGETIKGSTAGGLIGFEYNFTTGELFIGAMPNASWTLGLGIGASMKGGFTF